MLEAELPLEVLRDLRVLPRVDGDGVHLDEPQYRDAGGGGQDHAAVRRQLDAPSEEVGGDARARVPKPVENRGAVGVAVEPTLRD
jgi:hypothetical protein